MTINHYYLTGLAGWKHFFLLLNTLLSDVNNTDISEINTVYACILFKGHNKDKCSDCSYRTISSCPVVAKGLWSLCQRPEYWFLESWSGRHPISRRRQLTWTCSRSSHWNNSVLFVHPQATSLCPVSWCPVSLWRRPERAAHQKPLPQHWHHRPLPLVHQQPTWKQENFHWLGWKDVGTNLWQTCPGTRWN